MYATWPPVQLHLIFQSASPTAMPGARPWDIRSDRLDEELSNGCVCGARTRHAWAHAHTLNLGQVSKMIQTKLKAALIGTTAKKFFAKYDKDKGGTLDAAEFKKVVRTAMKVGPPWL